MNRDKLADMQDATGRCRKTALLICDDAGGQHAITTLLHRMDFEVIMHDQVFAVPVLIQIHNPDLILVSLAMEELTYGRPQIMCASRIASKKIPVIFLPDMNPALMQKVHAAVPM